MNKIVYSKLQEERVWFDEVQVKKITDNNGKDIGKFSTIRSKYNIGTPDSEYLRSLRIEFPVGTSARGIQKQENENGSISWTIRYVADDLTEGEELLEKMKMLKRCAAQAIYKNRSKVHNVKSSSRLESILDNMSDIMYVKTDDMGVRVEGSSPSKYLKLDTGTYSVDYKTRFERVVGKDKNGEPLMEEVPWELLEGMRVTFKPIVEFYRVFSGSVGQTFQAKLRSAIVIDVDKPKLRNEHEETAKALLGNESYLREQDEKWKMAREMAEARARGEGSEEDESFGDTSDLPVDALAAVKAVSNIPVIDSPETSLASSLTDFVKTEERSGFDGKAKMTELELPSIPGL